MKWFGRRDRDIDADLAEELRAHIEARAELHRQAGMSPEAAWEAALRQFGNPTRIHEEARSMHINEFLESLAQDLRYAGRGFKRNPGFTLSAVLALALGIGGSTAVFSVVDRVLFRALPYPQPERLVSVGFMTPLDTSEQMFSGVYSLWQRAETPFAQIAGFGGVVDCDLTEANPASLGCAQVESNFTATLGIQPMFGRSFTAQEDVPGGPDVALLTYGFWRSRFGGDRNVVGKTISINGAPTAILGVMPAEFEFPRLNRAELLVPLRLRRGLPPGASGRDMRAFARLKPGVTVAQALAGMMPLFTDFLPTVPAPFRKQVHLRVRPVRDLQTEGSRDASWMLLGAVAAVLLIACSNVANLLLARAARRHREMAVRTAIGASRMRMVRQMLTESLALAMCSGIVGCGLAWTMLRVLAAIAPAGIPRLDQAGLDGRALLFALAISTFSGAVFGVAPALALPRVESLTGARMVGASRGLVRQLLVVAQIAISLVLLTGATLLMRSLWNLENAPLGFDQNRAIGASVVLGPAHYGNARRQQEFFEALESQVAHIPGVGAVGITDSVPPTGRVRSRPFSSLQAEGHPRYTRDTGGMIVWRFITPGYFEAMGVPILQGRGFQEEDRDAARTATVLSESLARMLFPGETAVGRHVSFGEGEPWYLVVGVTADVHNSGVTERPSPEYYLVRRHGADDVYAQQIAPFGWRVGTVVVRTSMNAGAAAKALRAAAAEVDPTVPVDVATMRERVGRLAARPRFDAVLVTLFAAIGLLLAGIGLYGVMSFLVAQQTQEIGVRMAIGASPGDVMGMVLGRAARWTAAGAVVGIAGSLAAGKLLEGSRFGVRARDPWTMVVAVVVLCTVSLLAAWLPARRAAAVDPMTALRVE